MWKIGQRRGMLNIMPKIRNISEIKMQSYFWFEQAHFSLYLLDCCLKLFIGLLLVFPLHKKTGIVMLRGNYLTITVNTQTIYNKTTSNKQCQGNQISSHLKLLIKDMWYTLVDLLLFVLRTMYVGYKAFSLINKRRPLEQS